MMEKIKKKSYEEPREKKARERTWNHAVFQKKLT